MIENDLLSKCTTESEKETADLFDRLGLECIDISFKIYDSKQNPIGEIDGIFLDRENEIIIIYDDSNQKNDVNTKITKFFTKWNEVKNENEIFDKLPHLPHYPIYILYIDKANDRSQANISSIEYLLNEKMSIIYKDDFQYFSQMCDRINTWAKNDLYNFLEIKPLEMRVEIEATQIYIGNIPAYVYADRPDRILKYSYVSRRRKNDNGYQRMVDFDRIKQIRSQLEAGTLPGFPNSILLNSAEKLNITPHFKSHCPKSIKIAIPNHFSAFRIVDGQHRLLSFSQLNGSLQTKYHLPIVLLDNMPIEDEIKLFLDINDSPKNVDPSLRYELTHKLTWAKNSDNYLTKIGVAIVYELEKKNPIKGKIYSGVVGSHKKDTITLKSFVDSIKRHRLINFEGGVLQQDGVDDVASPVSFIQQILIHVNTLANDKEYFISNRGIELICNYISYVVSFYPNEDKREIIEKYSIPLVNLVNSKIDELRKYQGEKGFKDAFELIIQEIQIQLPKDNNIASCNKDHSKTDEIVSTLPIDQGGTGRHKCASCAYEEGLKDGGLGIERDLDKVNLTIPYSQKARRRHRSTKEAYKLGLKAGLELK